MSPLLWFPSHHPPSPPATRQSVRKVCPEGQNEISASASSRQYKGEIGLCCFPSLSFLTQTSRELGAPLYPVSHPHQRLLDQAPPPACKTLFSFLLQSRNWWWLIVLPPQVALAFSNSGDNSGHNCEGASWVPGNLPLSFSVLFCCSTECHSSF